ncbi:MAG: hypothetical protein Kow0042_24320 [Calditrichia bacterium]
MKTIFFYILLLTCWFDFLFPGASGHFLSAQGFFLPDTQRYALRLPIPFTKDDNYYLSLSPTQKIQFWIFQNRNRFWTEVRSREGAKIPTSMAQPWIDWNFASPGHSLMNLDFRESSLFVPPNVREYIDYKMGRSRYLPVASLAAASYLAYQLYQRYGYLLKKREENRYQGLMLSDREIRLMEILWENPGLRGEEWYISFIQNAPPGEVVYEIIEKDLSELEAKYLIKSKKLPEGVIQYFPAISRADLILKLKGELQNLDAQRYPERFLEIEELICKLQQ